MKFVSGGVQPSFTRSSVKVVAFDPLTDCLNRLLLGPRSFVVVHRRVCTAKAQRVFRRM